ncbi:TetR family transcriptional regulator [Cupriavidus sp. USMAA2-4]|uniref:TetR family transcriptional regulator n=1 Tax=Cupriavidus malaysiensis TaxID=367825 RepID=A0ABM6F9N1_9BURK|nr:MULTISPECIES: TetR/AcrR family transcriptional regulator [Cupriavidus]AOY95229.1 TetR family transcriptional regulator [Cupriavidus sp. USMAA2-4]AOZ01871.1 TetR family transcriptional regulator [Cupriavidus sp. USMAHM13]AOZ08392.1 TetR family transcriptional regulator [Cupriavidus malaysiensis]
MSTPTARKSAAAGTRARQAQDTRAKILKAAIKVFAQRGYEGGRVERISSLAKTYDRMIYYYFGSKEKLFVEVLETIYAQLNEAEQKLELDTEDPVRALSQLIDFVWHYYLEHPEFVAILSSENMSQGKHAKKSERLRDISRYALSVLDGILARGKAAGTFRADSQARDIYLVIASLGYFYNSNHHTLSAFLGEAMMSQPALAHWREVIQATVMRTVCVVAPDSSAPAAPGGAKAARARSARKA